MFFNNNKYFEILLPSLIINLNMMNLKKYKISDESFEDEEKIEEPISLIKNVKIQNSIIDNKYYQNRDDKIILRDESENIMNNSEMSISVQNGHHTQKNQNFNLSNCNENLSEHSSNFVKDKICTKEEQENFHHPQIIDEDVENFKRRLDITLKNFRTDTLKDFMSIKRHLLVEQKSIVDSERQKCEALLSSKIDQIENLKESLAKTKQSLTKETEIKEKLSLHLFKFKFLKKQKDLKIKIFNNVLKNYYLRKKKEKGVEKKIKEKRISKLKNKALGDLKANYEEMKTAKIIMSKENEFKKKIEELSQFYGKEVGDLRMKLQEANVNIEKYRDSKNQIQENLKKALMRGVVAMNLEAMNVLEGEDTNLKMIQNATNLMNLDSQEATTSKSSEQLNQNKFMNFEKKAVVKDNGWINACAVPNKLKSNIIDDCDSGEKLGSLNYNNQAIIYNNTNYNRDQDYQIPKDDYYSELSKSN
jgi:hypothetical protein